MVVASPIKGYDKVVEEHQLEKILGIARWDGEEREREERRGVVYGLVVMGQGEGGILPVETIALPGTGRLKLTGSLGDVCDALTSVLYSGYLSATCWNLGHQRERRTRSELGEDLLLRSPNHKFKIGRSAESP